LTADSVAWAISPTTRPYWHPVTWLSILLSVELFDLDPAGHPLVNVFIHVLNAILLFIVLKRMTGAFWKSLFVSVVFAIHPVNVESVAWFAERKNVLSKSFWMLTMLFYAHYAAQPSVARYVLVFVSLGLGLMAKPILITLPFVLLLLDVWPLERWGITRQPDTSRRFPAATPKRLILEKVPLLLLSIISVSISVGYAKHRGIMISGEEVSLVMRIANALASYVKYIGDMLWPRALAIFYPLPEYIPLWQTGLAFLLILGLTILGLLLIRKRPYFITGWLWYLGTLVPVIGIVQAGLWPAMADRFAYIPLIGLFIILAWGIPDAIKPGPYRRSTIILMATVAISLLSIKTWIQIGYWKNNETLFSHAVRVTEANPMAHNNLGIEQALKRRFDEAVRHFQTALDVSPGYAEAHNNLASTYKDMGRLDESITHYRRAVTIFPQYSKAHLNLARALSTTGNLDEAEKHYRRVLELVEDSPEAMIGLGNLLARKGNLDQAMEYYRATLTQFPNHPRGNEYMGKALLVQGRMDDALPYLRQALEMTPENTNARIALSNALIQTGRIPEAVSHLEAAAQQNPRNGEVLLNLGNALIQTGDIVNAVSYLERALIYFPDDNDTRQKVMQLKAALNKREHALAALKEYIKNPDNPMLHLEIARVYHSVGRLENAKSHYRQALSISPNAVPALEGLAALTASQEDFTGALENLLKINQLEPNRVDIPYNIACMYARQKRIGDALHWLKTAVQKGYNRWDQIKSDPDLDNIRGTEAYRQLVQSN